MRPIACFLATALVACSAPRKADRPLADGERPDSAAAFLRVALPNTPAGHDTEWTVDSATSTVTWVVRPHGAPASAPVVQQGATVVSMAAVAQLFALTQEAAFVGVKAENGGPDSTAGTVEVQANRRRRTVRGALPDPARGVARAVETLAPIRLTP
jgi:hypothetical protein